MYDRTERVYGINVHALCTKIIVDSDSPISRGGGGGGETFFPKTIFF